MPRKQIPCAICGQPMHNSSTSASAGTAAHRACRLVSCGTVAAYRRHLRKRETPCRPCKDAANAAFKEYSAKVRERDGVSPTQKARPAKRRECSDCGKVMRSGGTASTPRCKPCLLTHRAAKRRAATRRQRLEAKLAQAAAGVAANPAWPWVCGTCLRCNEAFARKGAASGYCSKRCRMRDRPKGSWISRSARLAIYERDNWTCQLCFEPVDPDLHYLDDWAPSLDHIEPQSWALIPDHSPANLRLAHRWCNSVRGDETHYTAADLAA